MKTHCTQNSLLFPSLNRRKTVAHFDGGAITSDAGGLLLQPVEQITGIIRQFAACFTDHRDPQRIYALALGYEAWPLTFSLLDLGSR